MKSIIVPLRERKAHDMMGKCTFKGKKNTNFKQRLRLSSDPQQKKLYDRGKGCSPTGPSGRHDSSTGTSPGCMTLFWNANNVNT